MKHFHFNMVDRKPFTACGILGVTGETDIEQVTCSKCKDWYSGKIMAHPQITKTV